MCKHPRDLSTRTQSPALRDLSLSVEMTRIGSTAVAEPRILTPHGCTAMICNRLLQLKYPVRSSRIVGEEQRNGNVADGNAPGRRAIEPPMMCVAVEGECGLMAIDNFGKPRATQVWKYFLRFALDGFGDRRVMRNDDGLGCSQHGDCTLQLQCFIDGSLHEGLDFLFAEGSQHTATESADESLGSGKAHAVVLITAAVKDFDALVRHHPHQLLFLATFIIVVSQHGHDRHAQAN